LTLANNSLKAKRYSGSPITSFLFTCRPRGLGLR
jgi:hypothetical protein